MGERAVDADKQRNRYGYEVLMKILFHKSTGDSPLSSPDLRGPHTLSLPLWPRSRSVMSSCPTRLTIVEIRGHATSSCGACKCDSAPGGSGHGSRPSQRSRPSQTNAWGRRSGASGPRRIAGWRSPACSSLKPAKYPADSCREAAGRRTLRWRPSRHSSTDSARWNECQHRFSFVNIERLGCEKRGTAILADCQNPTER
jgi:hypothetical protein